MGCANLGYLYTRDADGCGIKNDVYKSLDYYKKACDKGDKDSCNTVDIEIFIKKDFCSRGDILSPDACFELGTIYKNGHGGNKKDTKAASQYFNRACKLGNKDACKAYNQSNSK